MNKPSITLQVLVCNPDLFFSQSIYEFRKQWYTTVAFIELDDPMVNEFCQGI